ncbi:hypothetical protein EV363DRAFT_1340154 [Boletus edulis]|nr:hypothetical protein EV363DRAFT_1340154 [Boletus edulis]
MALMCLPLLSLRSVSVERIQSSLLLVFNTLQGLTARRRMCSKMRCCLDIRTAMGVRHFVFPSSHIQSRSLSGGCHVDVTGAQGIKTGPIHGWPAETPIPSL